MAKQKQKQNNKTLIHGNLPRSVKQVPMPKVKPPKK